MANLAARMDNLRDEMANRLGFDRAFIAYRVVTGRRLTSDSFQSKEVVRSLESP